MSLKDDYLKHVDNVMAALDKFGDFVEGLIISHEELEAINVTLVDENMELYKKIDKYEDEIRDLEAQVKHLEESR